MQPWYPFYWSDYSGKTFSLSQGQHGAYILLLRSLYVDGKPIMKEHCYSIARAMTEEERANVDFVLASYFVLSPAGYTNSRAEEVISEAEEAHMRRVSAGRTGKNKRNPTADEGQKTTKQCSSNAPAIPPTTTTTTTVEEDSPLRPPKPRREEVVLPDWLPPVAWGDWLTYRRSRRLSCALITLQKQIQQLDEYRDDGHNPTEVIDTAIARGWQGLCPPKGNSNAGHPTRRPSAHENLFAGFGISDLGKP